MIIDSGLWVRLNDEIQRIMLADLLRRGRFVWVTSDAGCNIFRPLDRLEILTASSPWQQRALAMFKPVNRLILYAVDNSEEIYRLYLRGGRTVGVTGGHPIMVSKSRVEGGSEAVAIPARELKVGMNLLGHADLSFFEGCEYDLPDWFFRLAGLWLADGCFVTTKGKSLGKMIISTGNNAAVLDFLRRIPRPKNLTERASAKLAEARPFHSTQETAALSVAAEMGISLSCVLRGVYHPEALAKGEFIYVKVKDNGDAWLCNLELVEQFKALGFNGNSHTKTIPNWLYTVSQRQIGLFLAGYFDGDGCISDRGPLAASVNRELIYGVRALLLRLGIESSINARTSIGGFRTKSALLYTLCVGAAVSIRRFIDRVPVTKDVSRMVSRSTGGQPDYPFKSRKLLRIERVEHGRGWMFDFDVPGNHMFVADSVLVHSSID